MASETRQTKGNEVQRPTEAINGSSSPNIRERKKEEERRLVLPLFADRTAAFNAWIATLLAVPAGIAALQEAGVCITANAARLAA